MKTIKLLKLILSAVLMISTANVPETHATEFLSVKDYLKQALAGLPKLTKETLTLNDAQLKTFKTIAPDSTDTSFTFYYGKTDAGKLEKVCTIVGQKGKEGPITLGVCFNLEGLIQGVKILTSEEERGKGIAEESYLKQFNNKKVSDAFALGKDVDGISGATWSSKAVAEAVRKSSFAFRELVQNKK